MIVVWFMQFYWKPTWFHSFQQRTSKTCHQCICRYSKHCCGTLMLWRLDAKATMPLDRIPLHFLAFKNSFLCRACRCISLCLCCYFIISLFIRRRCLLTGFLFTSWALGILFLYRAGWCISLYLCFLFFFFFCLESASANVFRLFSGFTDPPK